jgi:hypothetical protein
MTSKQTIKLPKNSIVTFDMDIADFKFFRDLLENQITEDMIDLEKMDQISNKAFYFNSKKT